MSSAAQPDFAKFSSRETRNARTLRVYMALRNQEIAQRIKDLREAKGNPPQPIVAAAIQVSLRTYQNWEAGDARPEYRNLEALAAYYKVSEEFILTGVENAQQESPIVVSDQMESGFIEFRGHVDKLIEKLDVITGYLERQEDLLQKIEGLAGGLPTPDNIGDLREELNAAAQALAEAGERVEARRRESEAAQAETRRRRSSS
jgi:transcriptional regulator with XRE-family HTH domain